MNEYKGYIHVLNTQKNQVKLYGLKVKIKNIKCRKVEVDKEKLIQITYKTENLSELIRFKRIVNNIYEV